MSEPRPDDHDPAADPGPTDEPTASGAAPVTEPATDQVAQPQRPRRVALLAVIASVIIVLDLITKIIAVALLTPGESPRILGGLVYFSLIRNPGAAFSMATGMTWVLAVIAVIVVVVIIRMAARLRSVPWAVCLGLILGGAIGNLIDRIFRSPGFMQGHVVDFVSVFGPNAEYFPVFNVADSAITIGGITLVVTALLGIDFDGTRLRGKEHQQAQEPGRG
ncbi:signal peptidase II [Nakamurella leprariae]|uniref:signal peptidase II n=1 Tax=Nakamurella leprariae TaxID=2803911 RepID=UPI002E2C8E3B|nr:signal peptidase II [Nakamurella leprariae]